MFGSGAINDFNSERFSSLIRPISVRTTSPSELRRILNTYRQMQNDGQRTRMKKGHLRESLMASSRQMSESRQITTPVRSRLLKAGTSTVHTRRPRERRGSGTRKVAGENALVKV